MASDCAPCLSGQPFNCGCFVNVGNSNGADTIARLYALEGNGQLDGSSANEIISNVVAYGFTYATLTCQQAFVEEQVISINCDPATGERVKSNPNCVECKRLAALVYADRQKLEQEAHALNPAYQIQVLDPAIAQSYLGILADQSDGVCKYVSNDTLYVCDQCIVENLSQNIQMNINAECDYTADTFVSAFSTGMSVQAAQSISQYQEALKTTGVDIKSVDDIKSLSIQMANSLKQMTTIVQLNSLRQTAFNIQAMTIDHNSTSVMVQNATQSITTSMFATLVSKVYNDVSVQNAINYSTLQQEIRIQTSFTSLINSLQTTVTTIENLLVNTVGEVMLTLLALILIIMFAFAALFFFKPGFLFGGTISDDQDAHDEED